MFPKYALKIRRSDLALLAMLNGGQEPEVQKGVTYLIVDTDPNGHNDIVSERDLFSNYEMAANSQLVMRLKKPRY